MASTNALSAYAGTLCQQFLAGAGPTPPAALYVALGNFVGNAFVEIIGTDYARQRLTQAVSSGGVMSNAAGLTFGPNSAVAWATVGALAVFDAASAGDLLWSGALTAPAIVAVGDSVTILAGALSTAQTASG